MARGWINLQTVSLQQNNPSRLTVTQKVINIHHLDTVTQSLTNILEAYLLAHCRKSSPLHTAVQYQSDPSNDKYRAAKKSGPFAIVSQKVPRVLLP